MSYFNMKKRAQKQKSMGAASLVFACICVRAVAVMVIIVQLAGQAEVPSGMTVAFPFIECCRPQTESYRQEVYSDLQ